MKCIIIFQFILFGLRYILCANILGVFPYALHSHLQIHQIIWTELLKQGHEMTVIVSLPIKSDIKNLSIIDISGPTSEGMSNFQNKEHSNVLETFGNPNINAFEYMSVFAEIGDKQLSDPNFKNIIENCSKYNYDLILMESAILYVAALGYVCKSPIIGISPLPIHDNYNRIIGNPSHPIVNPDNNLPYLEAKSFHQRLQSLTYIIRQDYSNFEIHEMMKKHYPTLTDQQIKTSGQNIDIMLVNANPVLRMPRSNMPNIIEISGLNIREPQPLSQDLKQYLDNAETGVIYISFGSVVTPSTFAEYNKKIFFDVISELPYKFLWKHENENENNIPQNLKLKQWVPQQDILRHPNIKLFITQGGIQSLEEALYAKVPVLVIPMFGDQFKNANRIKSIGLGETINFQKFNREDFKNMIIRIINDKSYKFRAEQLSTISIDKPMSGLETAIWWINYVIRNKRAELFKSHAIHIPLYQYYMIDLIAFIGIIIISSFLTLVFIIYFLYKKILSIYRLKKLKSTKLQ